MQKHSDILQDRSGALLTATAVTVNTAAGTAATIYSDNGVTIASNPLTTDANGLFGFYAADGTYSLMVGGALWKKVVLTGTGPVPQLTIVAEGTISGDNTGDGAGGGGGSVSSVSVTTANGVSGTVATATTTPAITLTLGAITPSSVAASGTVTGSNLSGTNTGDETGARIATLTHAASLKSSLVDADEVTGGDSAASFGLIRTTWGSVKAFLKTYFDTLYPSGSGTSSGTNTGDETGAGIRAKLGITTLSGSNTGDQTSVTGSAGSVVNAITFNNGGAGAVSGSTYNGSGAITVSYNTVGAPSASGSGASGTWGISISGNAATATALQTARTINGVAFDGTANITVADATKQATLVSGTNIKTVNSTSLLGSGDVSTGSVTSVSVTTANGVSGTVATATTTPAISLALGAITPTSVAASGSVAGSNLSGTNTGDQTITLTSDVTGSGTGSFAATIASGAVSLAKMANLAANSLIGNNTGGAATPVALTAAQTKTLLAIANTDVSGLGTMSTQNASAVAVTGGTLAGITSFAIRNAGTGAFDMTEAHSGTLTAGRTLTWNLNDAARSVSLSGNLTVSSAATISGTNTGDQTISIGGDVTASGSTGALSATVTKLNGVALSGLATGLLKNTTTTGVPSIAAAGTDYVVPSALAASGGAALVGFLQAGTGAVARTAQDKMRETISVKDFGAKGDGSTDDTAAIQAAVNAAIAAGGGVVRFPASASYYRTTAAITIDYSASPYSSGRFAKKIRLMGDTPTASWIVPDSGAYAAISFLGNATINEAYFEISGLRLSAAALTTGSTGLSLQKAAYVLLRDVIIESFDTGLYAVDVEQIGLYDCEVRFNTAGITGATGSMTLPNSCSFYNTTISNNVKSGAFISNANAFNFNGGSVQYNGVIGGASDNYGLQISEAGNGYGTVGFTNMIFEGNGGLADFVSGQTTGPCSISFDNVSFMRTATFASATVTGAANNGSGLVRLTVNSTTALTGKPKVMVTGVVGTVEANSATPWAFTIIDATHIDLVGSAFSHTYVSGGAVTVVGFATNCILAGGSSANANYSITNCTFKQDTVYLPSASRPTISLQNTNAKISDDGTNYFQNSVEKLTYSEPQRIGDDGSAWAAYTPTVTAAGGTFTATATGKTKKIGKTVYFEAAVTTTSYAATPTTPLTVTLPFPAASNAVVPVMNTTSVTNATGFIASGSSTVQIWKDATFPIVANGQTLAVSGVYETP